MNPKLKSNHFEGEVSLESFLGPETAAVAAVVTAVAAAPSFTPPAAFIAPATFANIATPPTSAALKATVGFTAISYGNCKKKKTFMRQNNNKKSYLVHANNKQMLEVLIPSITAKKHHAKLTILTTYQNK
jgi:hypothetical protein